MGFLLRLEEFVAEGRRHRAGDEEGGEERNRDRDGQGNQEQTGNACDEENREKHDDRGDGRGQNRHRHFARRFQDRVPAAGRAVEVALNVLQLHDGVVDQPADAQGQASQREHVQGLPGEIEHDEGHHDRKGNGDGNDQGAREITEEDQDDERGQQRSMQRLFDEVVDRLADVDRLVEGNAELHAGGDADHLRQGFAQRIHHRHSVGDGLFIDA